MRLALTGSTGFVGRHVLDAALDAGLSVTALTRKPQRPREQVEWIHASLDDRDALDQLVAAADAVIHVAGVINARDEAGFEAGNVLGTGALLAAAEAAGRPRFVHVSSLAAREPKLSLYGRSKARSETLVAASPLPHAIVRPPAVYGPWDRETLELFKMARRGLVLLPPRGRLSLIHVEDLARLLLALAEPGAPSGLTIEPDDGRDGGWSHNDFAFALGRAVGRKRMVTFAPRASVLKLAARIDRLVRGEKAKLTPDRAAYFCHPDWVADPVRAAPPELWTPQIDTEQGLTDTARWFRNVHWL